jgi:tripartite-type tricarboxylate transporter receptor subunit TctC
MIRRGLATLLVPLLAAYAVSAAGQAWPSKPLKMLVGATPGGTTDIVARVIAQKLSDRLGQPVVVEKSRPASAAISEWTRSRRRRPMATRSAWRTRACRSIRG